MNPFEVGEVDHAQRNQELGLPTWVRLAPMWRRFLGLVIDQIVVGIPVVIAGFVAGISFDKDVSSNQLLALNSGFIGVGFVYEFLMIGFLGRTVGKLALGTKVVRVDDGTNVMWSSSAIRALVPLLAGAVPGIGLVASSIVYASAGLDSRNQGLHDKACGSIVVMNPRPVTQ
jgi:uncharacterized RDD family membrane protein YckC